MKMRYLTLWLIPYLSLYALVGRWLRHYGNQRPTTKAMQLPPIASVYNTLKRGVCNKRCSASCEVFRSLPQAYWAFQRQHQQLINKILVLDPGFLPHGLIH